MLNQKNSSSTSSKRGLSLSRSVPSNLILNVSQMKPVKRLKIKDENTLRSIKKCWQESARGEMVSKKCNRNEKQLIDVVKDEEEIDYNIKSIQQYIFGRISKDKRKKYVYNIYRGALYSCFKLKHPPFESVKSKCIYLNEATVSHQKFLLLDLDQTLICTVKEQPYGEKKTAYKFIYRPHLFTFLQKMSHCYEIYAFTAAQKGYAQAVVNKLNRSKVFIKDVLHRENCLQTKKGLFIKDLRIIQNRPLKHLVLVDNLVQSFGLQLDNGVPILQFGGQSEDNELLKLIPFLEELSEVDDVRPVLQQRYRLREVGNLNRKRVQDYFISE